MTPHPYVYALWALSCVAEAAVVLSILKGGAARRWPFLLALVAFDLIHNALLVAHLGRAHYRHYFYIYWIGQGIRAPLSLGLLWDVARSMPILKYVPKHIGATLLTLGLTLTAGAVYMTAQHHPHTYPLIAHVLMIRGCVTVAWMCFALTLLGSISFLGLGWRMEAVNITTGFVVSGIAAVLAASLTSSWPHYGRLIDQLQTCIDIVVLCSWARTLYRPPLPDAPLSDLTLNAAIEIFQEHPTV
jgi:hypothetical protein